MQKILQPIFPLIDFLFPAQCLHCSGACSGPLCDTCDLALHTLAQANRCEICAKPLPDGSACGWCRGKGLPNILRVVGLGLFDEPLKTLIHEMKYRNRWPIAEFLAEALLDQPRVMAMLMGIDVIVPVPLHWRRQMERGYNQAEVIAHRLAKGMRIAVVRSAIRTRYTPTQTQMNSRAARLENLKDAFALEDDRKISGKRVLLVDDVMTSGATLRALARCLVPAKPASISAIVLAVADPRHADFQTV